MNKHPEPAGLSEKTSRDLHNRDGNGLRRSADTICELIDSLEVDVQAVLDAPTLENRTSISDNLQAIQNCQERLEHCSKMMHEITGQDYLPKWYQKYLQDFMPYIIMYQMFGHVHGNSNVGKENVK